MRALSILLILASTVAAHADGVPDRVVIHLLDPRGAVAGEQTMPIEWGERRADVIATRLLNVTEATKLRALLRKDLADDKNFPLCGHSPAYAVAVTPDGKPTITVTLCATCGTWSKQGELRALHGKSSLEYLDTLLPLPDVFRHADGEPANTFTPTSDGKRTPFEHLKVQAGG